MKKLMLLLALIIGTFALTTSAYAIVTFPITDFKYTGETALYNPTSGLYQTAGYTPAVGDEVWSIGKMINTVNPVTGDTYNLSSSEEYTYMVGGLYVAANPFTGQYYLAPGTSSQGNPVTGKAWVVVWKDNSAPDYSITALTQTNYGTPYPLLDPTGTIINDGTPWMTGVLEGSPSWTAGIAYQATITDNSAANGVSGSDLSWIHLQTLTFDDARWGGTITGSFNDQVGPTNYYGLGNTGLTRDAKLTSTFQQDLLGGFFNRDNDPITAPIVPEPASMLLLGMGLLGVIPVVRRKKVA